MIDLLKLSMENKWPHVVEIYKNNPSAHKAKLTISEETALHIAISSYYSKSPNQLAICVEQMIDLMEKEGSLIDVLSMQNVRGDTALHLAAAVGCAAICECVAKRDRKLITIRNVYGETPLFTAAHHGKLQAFQCLRELYNDGKDEEAEPDDSLCRRKDGNTILHSAISGEYFTLAYQIIRYYPRLVTSINVDGESSLHVLARKNKVFKSRSQLSLYETIIYNCIFVYELKQQDYDPWAIQNGHSRRSVINYPENYKTCLSIFLFLWIPIYIIIFSACFPSRRNQNGNSEDEENQQQTHTRASQIEQNSGGDAAIAGNYTTCTSFLKIAEKLIGTVGFGWIKGIREKKQRHCYAVQIMNELINSESTYKYNRNGGQRPFYESNHINLGEIMIIPDEGDNGHQTLEKLGHVSVIRATPLLVAAKTGIPEMVKKIISTFPEAIQDLDSTGKNVLLLAVENRQACVLDYLLKINLPEYMLLQVDNEGNSILHLAANMGEFQPWNIPTTTLHLQWEIKWYKQVKETIPRLRFAQYNSKGETPKKIFARTHQDLVKEGTDTLKKTSESCSVIAALVATVAFASSATVPGGLDDKTGYPILAFDIFSITSLVALCLAVAALVFFLTIITSRCKPRDFHTKLPRRLLIGLTSLFGSILAVLVSFFAGHNFILSNKLKLATVPIYSFASLPIMFFTIVHLPFYINFALATSRKAPLRSYEVFSQK